jgi:RNA polymerase sigma factor (sigma-70 family)
VIVPHLGAAYTLAAALVRNDHDAQDVVQQACLRALKYFAGYRGDNPRAWLLAIVRNSCHSWLASTQQGAAFIAFDETEHGQADERPLADVALIRSAEREAVHAALAMLAPVYREVVVLRELHELSYREIAEVVDAPVGTVMSRLWRARQQLAEILAAPEAP